MNVGYLMTEGGDFLMTENGDYLVIEIPGDQPTFRVDDTAKQAPMDTN